MRFDISDLASQFREHLVRPGLVLFVFPSKHPHDVVKDDVGEVERVDELLHLP